MMASAEGAAPACPGLPTCPASLAACDEGALLGSHASASTPMSCEMYLS